MQIRHYPLNKADMDYIKAMLERLPIDVKRQLIYRYSVEFSYGYMSEPLEHKRENAGRFRANTTLRENVRRYMSEKNAPTWHVPQICGNCDHLNMQGVCTKFNEPVPDEYTTKENDCEQYLNSIPF